MVSCHLSRTSTVAAFHHGFCFKGMNAFDEYASQKVSIHILYYDIYLKLSIFTLVFQKLLLIFIQSVSVRSPPNARARFWIKRFDWTSLSVI